MRLPYKGHVISWEPRVRFGKHLPIPWEKEYACTAGSAAEARVLLDMKARRDGYGLGGVQGLTIDAEKLDLFL
jgi:hypothetical protein